MAKTRVRQQLNRHGAIAKNGPKVKVFVFRTWRGKPDGGGKQAFEACVNVGKTQTACVWHRNPRKAIAGAMHAAARNIGRRRGAFAGFRRRRRR